MSHNDRERDYQRRMRESRQAKRLSQVTAPPAQFLPFGTAAGLLGVCTRTLRRMIQRGEFPPPVKRGRLSLVPRQDYDRYASKLLQQRASN